MDIKAYRLEEVSERLDAASSIPIRAVVRAVAGRWSASRPSSCRLSGESPLRVVDIMERIRRRGVRRWEGLCLEKVEALVQVMIR